MPGNSLKLLGKGFCVGSADVVPGISGGTMAFILGIYPQLINAIKSFDSDWLVSILKLDLAGIIGKPHFSFLIPLFAGVVCALFFFTNVISLPVLIRNEPEIIYGLFFGLILGSVFFILRHLGASVLTRQFVFILPGIVLGGFVVALTPASTPDDNWFIFLCGVLAISAMILPGISGSFVLLIMKKYAYIFDAIGQFDLSILIPFLTGALVGIALFSRFLSFLLKNFYRQTVSFITGLLIASLYVIWPFQDRAFAIIRGREIVTASAPHWPNAWSAQVGYVMLMMLVGVAMVVVLELFADKS